MDRDSRPEGQPWMLLNNADAFIFFFFLFWASACYTHPVLPPIESSKYLSAEHFDGRRAKGDTANLKKTVSLSSRVVEADKLDHQFISISPFNLVSHSQHYTRAHSSSQQEILSKKGKLGELFALKTAPPLIVLGPFVSLSLAFFQEVYLQYANSPVLTYGGSFYFSGHRSSSTSSSSPIPEEEFPIRVSIRRSNTDSRRPSDRHHRSSSKIAFAFIFQDTRSRSRCIILDPGEIRHHTTSTPQHNYIPPK